MNTFEPRQNTWNSRVRNLLKMNQDITECQHFSNGNIIFQKIFTSLKKVDTLLFLCLVGFVTLIPLIFYPQVKSTFTMPKLLILRWISLASILLLTYKMYTERSFSYLKTRFLNYLSFYAIAVLLSTIFSVQIYASLFGTYGRFVGIFTLLNFLYLPFLAINVIKTKKQLHALITISIGIAFALAVFGLMQKYSDPDTSKWGAVFQKIVGNSKYWTQDPTDRVFGTVGHSNHFGAYLSFHVMLALGMLLMLKNWWKRILLGFSAVIMVMTVFGTASRGALLGLVAGAAVFALFTLKIIWPKNEKKGYSILAAFVGMLLILFILRGFLLEKAKTLNVVQRSLETIQFMREGNIPDRVSWWYSSWEMFKDRPIFGQGLSTFSEVYNGYRRRDYRVPENIQDTTTPEYAHMEFFDILATQGIVGIVFYFLLIGSVLLLLAKSVWKGKKSDQWVHLGILTALITYLGQVLLSFGVITTLIFFWLFLGIGIVAVFLDRSEEVQEKKIALGKKTVLIIACGVLFLSLAGFYFAFRHFEAEYYFRQAKQESKLGNFQQAWIYYQKTIYLMPYEYVYFHDYAEDLFNVTSEYITRSSDEQVSTLEKNFYEIVGVFMRAIEISPKQPYLHANLGLAYLTVSDIYGQLHRKEDAKKLYELGVQEYKNSIELGKNNPIYPYTLGYAYYKLNEFENAIPYLQMALEIRDPMKNIYYLLASSYFQIGDKVKALEWVQKAQEDDSETAEEHQLFKDIVGAGTDIDPEIETEIDTRTNL
ncbi:O-antigen ligase family protein [Candidatus Peregrinibacteria bacterium]|nr:O-antigen ligase family protein [Candidatus Peregrinibacteria bacterium]